MELIRVNGVQLEVRRVLPQAGKGSGSDTDARPRAPIVALHEGLGSVSMWATRSLDWLQALADHTSRATIAYSRQGYGASDDRPEVRGAGRLPPDYMHHEAWCVLPALLQALPCPQPPVLLGHSDGATIALLHASRHPVVACVVMAPHLFVEDISIRAITRARIEYQQGDLRSRLARHHRQVDTAFWQWNDVWLSPGFQGFDIRDACRQIASPVLAIQGEDDPYGTMAQIEAIATERRLAAHAHDTHLLQLTHCGHSPHRDQAAACLDTIGRFLAPLR